MNTALTFIGEKKDTIIKAMICDLIGSADCVTLSRNWATRVAVDKALDKAGIEALRAEMPNVDIIQTRHTDTPIKLFIADMDSTIVTGETLDELAGYAGFGEKVAAITKRAMNGELDFEAAITERVALLKGLPAEVLEKAYTDKTVLSTGAMGAVQSMAAHGVHCVLVSGGFTFFTEKVAKDCGFHAHFGNVLDIQDGTLTGKLGAPILGPDAKLNILREQCAQLGITPQRACAIGDGANDRFMLEEVQKHGGLALAYHPKQILAGAIPNQIHVSDLRTILYAQGYTDEDIAI